MMNQTYLQKKDTVDKNLPYLFLHYGLG